MRTARLRSPRAIRIDEYDLDAVVVEQDPAGVLDFRLELGSGLGIFWALPSSRGGRLRLAHVDGAAYDLDEPILVADPWCGDLPPLTWDGELLALEGGDQLISVRVEATRQPASYHCELGVRRAGGQVDTLHLRWSGS